MRKILDQNSGTPENSDIDQKNGTPVKTNLFQGRTEGEKGNSTFPDWDINPPSQFINPRLKKQ